MIENTQRSYRKGRKRNRNRIKISRMEHAGIDDYKRENMSKL